MGKLMGKGLHNRGHEIVRMEATNDNQTDVRQIQDTSNIEALFQGASNIEYIDALFQQSTLLQKERTILFPSIVFLPELQVSDNRNAAAGGGNHTDNGANEHCTQLQSWEL